MRGLLYCNFLLNRKWFLAAGITAVLCTAACAVLAVVLGDAPEYKQLIGSTFILTEVVVLAVCEEWLARNLERNIKCRFTDLTLAGGISKNTFVLSELVTNVIAITIGFAMCMAMTGVMSAVDSSFWSVENVKILTAFTLLIGAVDWIMLPLVIKLKSAEKAGMTTGLIAGFGIVFPIVVAFNLNEMNLMETLMKLLAKPWFFPVFIGACAALYAVFYAIMLRRVKKGDVC